MTQLDSPRGRDDLALEAAALGAGTILMFRAAFVITGLAAVGLGSALLLWPTKTIVATAAIAGIYFVVAGAVRLILAVFASGVSAGHRVVNMLFGVLLVAAGVIALRNLTIAAVSLVILAVVVIGVGWIIEGLVSIVESRGASKPAWAILYGLLSIVAGVSVVGVPDWAVVALVLYVGIASIVLGFVGIVRGVQFGRGVRSSAQSAR